MFVRATLTHAIFRLLGSLTAIVRTYTYRHTYIQASLLTYITNVHTAEILTYIDIDINIKNPNAHSFMHGMPLRLGPVP